MGVLGNSIEPKVEPSFVRVYSILYHLSSDKYYLYRQCEWPHKSGNSRPNSPSEVTHYGSKAYSPMVQNQRLGSTILTLLWIGYSNLCKLLEFSRPQLSFLDSEGRQLWLYSTSLHFYNFWDHQHSTSEAMDKYSITLENIKEEELYLLLQILLLVRPPKYLPYKKHLSSFYFLLWKTEKGQGEEFITCVLVRVFLLTLQD